MDIDNTLNDIPQKLEIHGRHPNFSAFPAKTRQFIFKDPIYVASPTKLYNVKECYSAVDFSLVNMPSLIGIGKEFICILEGGLYLNTSIRSNILGIMRIKKLQFLIISNTKNFIRCTGNTEPFEIVCNHLNSKERDLLECQEELISKNYKQFAKF